MKKVIKVGSDEFELSVNAYTPVLYRECFGGDIFKDILCVDNSDTKEKISLAARLLYVMVRDSATSKIEYRPALKALPKLLELWKLNIATSVEGKNKNSEGNELTFSLYLLRCIQLGLSIDDLKYLTVGMIFDLYTEVFNSRESETGEIVREATQADMDAF